MCSRSTSRPRTPTAMSSCGSRRRTWCTWATRSSTASTGSSTSRAVGTSRGGSPGARASERVLPRIDDDTKVIPGHGPATDKATLQKYHDMLVGVRAAVAKLVKEKKTLEQVVAAKPTAPWDEVWGKGYLKPDMFATLLYTELSKRKS